MTLPIPRFMTRASQRRRHAAHAERRDPFTARYRKLDEGALAHICEVIEAMTRREAEDRATHLRAASPAGIAQTLGGLKLDWARRELEANPEARIAVVGLVPREPHREVFEVIDDVGPAFPFYEPPNRPAPDRDITSKAPLIRYMLPQTLSAEEVAAFKACPPENGVERRFRERWAAIEAERDRSGLRALATLVTAFTTRLSFLQLLQARARSLVKVSRSASTWRWECPGCGWYMDERADHEGMDEPPNGETAESIAARPFCRRCQDLQLGAVKPAPAGSV